MGITTDVVTVLHPAAEDVAETQRLAPRLSSLQGMTVGLIDNHKRHADVYLEKLGRLLQEGTACLEWSRTGRSARVCRRPMRCWINWPVNATRSSMPWPIEGPAPRGVSTTGSKPKSGAAPPSPSSHMPSPRRPVSGLRLWGCPSTRWWSSSIPSPVRPEPRRKTLRTRAWRRSSVGW